MVDLFPIFLKLLAKIYKPYETTASLVIKQRIDEMSIVTIGL